MQRHAHACPAPATLALPHAGQRPPGRASHPATSYGGLTPTSLAAPVGGLKKKPVRDHHNLQGTVHNSLHPHVDCAASLCSALEAPPQTCWCSSGYA